MPRRLVVSMTSAQHDHVRVLVEELRARGITVREGDEGRWPRRVPPDEARVVHLHFTTQVVATPSLLRALRSMAAVLTHLGLLRLRGYHLVWTVHNDANHDDLHPGLERLFQSLLARVLCTRLVALSEVSGAGLRRRFGRRVAQRIRVVPLPTFEPVYGPRRERDAARQEIGVDGTPRPLLLVLGNLRRYKGLDALAAAVERLGPTAAAATWAVAGRPRDPEAVVEVERLRAGTTHVVTELRPLTSEEVATWACAADWMVLPYHRINNSGILALALTYHVPVVVAGLPGLEEALRTPAGPAGIVYDAADPAGLVGALAEALATTDDAYAGLVARASEAAAAIAPDRVIPPLLDVYREAAGLSASPS